MTASRTEAIDGLDTTIDFHRPFIPERLTSLAYTRVYGRLSQAERLHYNQNFALYMNEKTAFLEEELTDFMLAVAGLECARDLRGDLLRLILDEDRHAAQFRDLNRRAAAHLYRGQHNAFVLPTRGQSFWGKRLLRAPLLFPFVLWIILLFEERSLYYTATYLEERDSLELNFVDIHQRHAQDETSHLSVDDELVRLLWDSRPLPLRRFNALLLKAIFAEYLYHPKRAAIEILKVSFDGHPLLPTMVEQTLELRHHHDFLRSLYNRRTNPHTLGLMDNRPEFRSLAQMIAGYETA